MEIKLENKSEKEERDENWREGKTGQMPRRDLFICWSPDGLQATTNDPGNT